MAWRFRRRITIAPGLRLNVSGSGLSVSAGPRGASLSFGRRGTFLNTGIPGTGLYSRERLSPPSHKRPPASDLPTVMRKAVAKVADDGRLTLANPDGTLMSPELEAAARKQGKETLIAFLHEQAEERNNAIDALGNLHEHSPDPREPPKYRAAKFDETEPPAPIPLKYSLLDRLFRKRRERVDAANTKSLETHGVNVAVFNERKRVHESTQRGRRLLYEQLVLTDPNAMETVLEERLQAINWPRETTVAFEIVDGGKTVYADVDLPEIEDMPTESFAVAARELALKGKEMSEKRVRELYLRHVHSVGLRVAGEVFAGLPKCDLLGLSGFSQRPNKATGQVEDQFLYSSRISRAQWLRLNFDEQEKISPVEAFELFDTRRDVSKTGVFKPIVPFARE